MSFFSYHSVSQSISPLSILVVRSPRPLRGAISTVVNTHKFHGKKLSICLCRSLSTAVTKKKLSSDDRFLRIIDYEMSQLEDHDSVEIPAGFPLEVQDKPGESTIFLSRKYQDENIDVQVYMPNIDEDDDDDDEGENENEDENDDSDGDGDDDKEDIVQSSILLVVRISKGNGICLEFDITAYPDDISIDSLSLNDLETSSKDHFAYEGPDFEDLDQEMQGAFYKYLEVRGIKPSTMNVIHEYMINKDQTEYKLWLENLKSFVNF